MDLLQSRIYDVIYGTDYTVKALEVMVWAGARPEEFSEYRGEFPTEDADDGKPEVKPTRC